MRKLLLAIAFLLLPTLARAQPADSTGSKGSFVPALKKTGALSSGASTVVLDLFGRAGVTMDLQTTDFDGGVCALASLDGGANYFQVQFVDIGTQLRVSGCQAVGTSSTQKYVDLPAGATQLKITVSAYVAGTANVTLSATMGKNPAYSEQGLPVSIYNYTPEATKEIDDTFGGAGESFDLGGGVRKDTPTALCSADGKYCPPIVDGSGRQWVHDDLAVATLNSINLQPLDLTTNATLDSLSDTLSGVITAHQGMAFATLGNLAGQITFEAGLGGVYVPIGPVLQDGTYSTGPVTLSGVPAVFSLAVPGGFNSVRATVSAYTSGSGDSYLMATTNPTMFPIQPVSVTGPVSLPTGAATEVTLASVLAKLNATLAVTQSGTWVVQPGNTANTTAWKVDGSAVTQPVSLVGQSLSFAYVNATASGDTALLAGASLGNRIYRVECNNASASVAVVATLKLGSTTVGKVGLPAAVGQKVWQFAGPNYLPTGASTAVNINLSAGSADVGCSTYYVAN